MQTTVNMLVEYEGEFARRVSGELWSSLSRAALTSGERHTKTTALWDALQAPSEPENVEIAARIFVMDQDHPEAVDALEPLRDRDALHGLVLAVPENPSPLAGSLLYQGVERLKEAGLRAGNIEPALLTGGPEECERYALRLLERLRVAR